jgi:hypothetical protein
MLAGPTSHARDRTIAGWGWMFRCQLCSHVTAPRVRVSYLVIGTRMRKYPKRDKVNREVYRCRDGKWKWVGGDDPGGTGHEIAKCLMVCPACAEARQKA